MSATVIALLILGVLAMSLKRRKKHMQAMLRGRRNRPNPSGIEHIKTQHSRVRGPGRTHSKPRDH